VERRLTRRSGVALQDFSRRLMRSTREKHSDEWSNEAVPTTAVVEVAEAEERGSAQDLEKMLRATTEPWEGLAKAEVSPQQSDSGEVEERCGRLGLRLELSILRCPNSNSGPIGGVYG